ncbi:MAG TPA: chromate efflux transporter [Vicinamibacterales bacterium]|nr:chromate efflux transporter [Vicinamibacterales bacterium]
MAARGTALSELASLFLKLGTTAFGGPAAHIAMMEDEVVRRRGWLNHEQFLDYLGATNLIPGPNSTELAIHIGQARAGWRGLMIAGVSFILPAALIVTAVAWVYIRFGRLPAAAGLLWGVKPVVIAIVCQALWRLAQTAVKTVGLGLLGAAAIAAVAAGLHELIVLAGAAVAMAAVPLVRGRTLPGLGLAVVLSRPGTVTATAALGAIAAVPVSLSGLFLVFVKAGAVLFGSGYVLLAFLRADLVERLGWLTEAQLLDAIAVGQVTPGPVFTTATFVGYVLAGVPGAAVATVGIFLPAFIFVAISGPLVPLIRRSPIAGSMLDGVNVASLALMTVVLWQLARATFVDRGAVAVGIVSIMTLAFWRINSAWLIIAGAALGWWAG